MTRQPHVNTNPVANQYAADGERIVEFNSGKAGGPGGLISFRRRADGTLSVDLYRLDEGVTVMVEQPPAPPHPAHEQCADGCGLAVTHDGACLNRPGGRVVCSETDHVAQP